MYVCVCVCVCVSERKNEIVMFSCITRFFFKFKRLALKTTF